MKTKAQITAQIESLETNSAWARGVKAYAIQLIESYDGETLPSDRDTLKKTLLNGAESWAQYSYGGCSLIYDSDICERLCSPSEIKKARNGARAPNSRETWLDCQTRALGQAFARIASAAK